jgi:hypothetical protein
MKTRPKIDTAPEQEQSFQLTACLEFVQTTERGNNLLADLIALTPVLDDLGRYARLKPSCRSTSAALWCAQSHQRIALDQVKYRQNVALHFLSDEYSDQMAHGCMR